jgi:hypothetical protein
MFKSTSRARNLSTFVLSFVSWKIRKSATVDWMHLRRAEAIVTVFGRLVDLDRQVQSSLGALAHSRPNDAEKRELLASILSAAATYRQAYTRSSILFDEPALSSLERLDRIYWERFVVAMFTAEIKVHPTALSSPKLRARPKFKAL